LAPEDDDEKTEGIAETDDERTPLFVGQQRADQTLSRERHAHRETGRQTRRRERNQRAVQFDFTLAAHRFENDRGSRRLAFVDVPLLRIG